VVLFSVVNFETQVRLQTMPKAAAGQSPLYTGTFDCAKKIFLKEVFMMILLIK